MDDPSRLSVVSDEATTQMGLSFAVTVGASSIPAGELNIVIPRDIVDSRLGTPMSETKFKVTSDPSDEKTVSPYQKMDIGFVERNDEGEYGDNICYWYTDEESGDIIIENIGELSPGYHRRHILLRVHEPCCEERDGG